MGSDAAVPVGEGWTRHNAELLVHAPSQVFFAQFGERRGKYLMREDGGSGFTVCPAPLAGSDHPLEVRAAASSVLRQQSSGAVAETDRKMDRAVVIPEMPKTARLALRFPLGFLDSPAAAYGLFSGLRGNSGAAHWVASQFHQRLLPEIAKRIHGWWDSEAEMPEELLFRGSHVGSLAKVLRDLLEGFDRDLLQGPHCFGGCDVAVAVLIGENLVVATAGQASATLLFEDAEPVVLIATPDVVVPAALSQLPAGRSSEDGALHGSDGCWTRAKSSWDAEEAALSSGSNAGVEAGSVHKILRAPTAFEVLGVGEDGPASASEVRSAYKRLALRVHPDKVRDCEPGDAKAAFARLEAASRILEAMAEHNVVACRELHRVLRSDPLTLRGAAAILQVELDAEEHQVKNALSKLEEALGKAKGLSSECETLLLQGFDAAKEAATTMRNVRQNGSPGAIVERLLGEGVPPKNFQSLGMRDLRRLGAKAVVKTASWRPGEAMRVALCCGGTAELPLSELQASASVFTWQPKASAREWATRALALPSRQMDSSASAMCICIRDRADDDMVGDFEDGRPSKRLKGPPGPKSVRVRHLLLRCAEIGRQLLDDPMARRPRGSAARAGASAAQASAVPRTPVETEVELVGILKDLLSKKETDQQRLVTFRELCKQVSECSSADNAGQLCGDLGWISRGQVEMAFEQASFSLRVGEFSDVTTTSRGMHIIQRLA